MFKRFKNVLRENGFTLVELLIVISIVTLISGFLFFSIDSAKAKSRDAIRLSDMRQINTAALMYYQDNGVSPSSLDDLVKKVYLSSVPVDPKTKEPYHQVVVKNNGKNIFIIDATYETNTIRNSSGEFVYEKVGAIIGDIDVSKICTSTFIDVTTGNEIKLDYPLCDNGVLKDQIIGLNDPKEEVGNVSTSTENYEWSDRLTPAKWRDAFTECSNLGAGWVLPSVEQLTSGIINNKLDKLYQYWSRDGVTDPNYPNTAITAYYADAPGYPENHVANSWDNISTNYNVVCIKSGESIEVPPVYNYEWSDKLTPTKWRDAFTECSNLGAGWVLPNKDQLIDGMIYNKVNRNYIYWSRDRSNDSNYPSKVIGVGSLSEYWEDQDVVYNVQCIKSGENVDAPLVEYYYEWSNKLKPAKWRDAFTECSNLGTGWVLPSASQLIDGQRKNKVDGLYEYWSRDKVTDSNYPNMAIGVGSASQYWEDIDILYNVQCIKSGESIDFPVMYNYEWSDKLTPAKWRDAFTECSNLGAGWVLPSADQLMDGQRINKVDRNYLYWSRDRVSDPNYPNMAVGVGSLSLSWENIDILYNVQCIKSGENI